MQCPVQKRGGTVETIQERFDKERDRHDVDIFVIPAGEWKGPLTLSRTCEVKGAGATLWTEGTPALIVEADGVTLNGLRVERTECGKTGRMAAAIDCKGHAVQFSDVEVHGTILHAPNCITDWELPGKVDFGAFAAGKENFFSFPLVLREAANISLRISGAAFQDTQLPAGARKVAFKMEAMRAGTTLYGDVLVISNGIVRRIIMSGRAENDAPVWQASLPPQTSYKGQKLGASTTSIPSQALSARGQAAPSASMLPADTVVRGQRVPVADQENLTVSYADRGHKQKLEVDIYAFCLTAEGKVRSDDDLVFFGNPTPAHSGVCMKEEDMVLSPATLPMEIARVLLCCSVYDDGSGADFHAVEEPEVRVQLAAHSLVFPLTELVREKTVEALELYRRKGDWRLRFIGAGWAAGLPTLCRRYGVEVD